MSSVSLNKTLSPRSGENGFTLLEVLIVMGILIFISFGIYQATTDTFRLRESLSSEGNFYNNIRLAMSILQRDVTLIYSPVLMAKQPQPGAAPQPQAASQGPLDNPAQVSNFWSAALDASGIRASRFQGTDHKVSFVSVGHIRMYKGTAESEFAKVTYEVRTDPDDKKNNYMMLVKSETTDAFNMDDVRDPLMKNYVILRGIKTFTFTYYQRDGQVWRTLKAWDTEREENRNKYPDFIEVTMEVIGPKGISFEGKYRFRPEIPFYGVPEKM